MSPSGVLFVSETVMRASIALLMNNVPWRIYEMMAIEMETNPIAFAPNPF
jgi:hypothetical protein